MPVQVHLLPALIPTSALEGSVAVVTDVLRATTVMVQALASGCQRIVPCLEIDEAIERHRKCPTGTAILCGERGGKPIAGFDLGNSPADFTSAACAGKTLFMTTTNGTRAIHACAAASRVFIAAFVNLAAVVQRIGLDIEEGRPVHIVCAGTGGEVSWEDTLLAGSVVQKLASRFDLDTLRLNDSAQLALAAAPRDPGQLARLMRLGRGGRNVESLGLGRDIDDAARLDRFAFVPRWQPDNEAGAIERGT